jgi:dienelactone hydrolase
MVKSMSPYPVERYLFRMRLFRSASIALALLLVFGLVLAQNYAPPPSQLPDEATLKTIADKTRKLGQIIESLRRQGVHDPYLAEVEIFHKAATWIVRHQEFYQKDAGAWTIEALDRGLLRASQVAQGEAPWLQHSGYPVVRAYRSRVDGSVQPYAVTFPAAYGKDRAKKWRVDVVLHGRDASLTEVKFVHQHNGQATAPKEQGFVQLDIYGRGNNAYRWAGETDVFEVMDHFTAVERLLGRDHLLDPARVVLRGFSMGGAGTWHLGLHHPSRWCVLGPGAGFTTTHGYVKNLPDKLPPEQEACLRIYDAVDYAENAFDVPVVAYGGDQDPQLQAARNILARLEPLQIPMKLLIAPGLKHQFPPEWRKKAEESYAPFLAKGRDEYPKHVHFVTYTLRYPSCAWVEIIGLDRHYHRALVDAEQTETGFSVKTTNVQALHLGLPANPSLPSQVKIDGQELTVRPWLSRVGTYHIYLERRDGCWTAVLPQKLLTARVRRPSKVSGLQGPIDDAFMDSFLCVRGTGEARYPATKQYTDDCLKRFAEEWSKYLRGDLPVKDDQEVTEEDIAGRNLILFGDPASNSLIAQVLDGLPLSWTKEQIKLGGKSYQAADHIPILIYPSPLTTNLRYIVLNSGHTFHAADFRGTNALLYPRLGDYAILKLAGQKTPAAAEVVQAGLFDDHWQLPEPNRKIRN